MVGSGARVLGPITIGNNVKIAANAVVINEVPPDCTCVGVPGRIVKKGQKKVDLDQIHIPDPVSQEFCRMQKEIDDLKAIINELKEKKDESI